LPSSPTWCRSTRCSPPPFCGRGAYRCCSGSRTGRRAGRSRSPNGSPQACSPSTRHRFRCGRRRSSPIGHGIDTARFGCVARASDPGRLRVVALGRTSPAKGFEAIVRAAELAGVELEIYGPSSTEEERRERTRLLALGASLKAPVPYSQVDALLAAKDVLVDNMREGALDKVVYEAASTCMPVLASNSGFAELLPPELRFARDDSAELAAKLRSLAAVNRDELGRTLRAKVEARHSVEHWADAVLEAAAR
jgi:glycosyltransferase involved in cell wall biosynthesis